MPAEFFSYLLDNPIFTILYHYLVMSIEDLKMFYVMLPDGSDIDYWIIGCGQDGTKLCDIPSQS